MHYGPCMDLKIWKSKEFLTYLFFFFRLLINRQLLDMTDPPPALSSTPFRPKTASRPLNIPYSHLLRILPPYAAVDLDDWRIIPNPRFSPTLKGRTATVLQPLGHDPSSSSSCSPPSLLLPWPLAWIINYLMESIHR